MSTAAKPTPIPPLLAKYLANLAKRPLYTKAVTAGTLCFIQEILANHLAGVPIPLSKSLAPTGGSSPLYPLAALLSELKIDARAFKLAAYGFLVSAPMGHFLMGLLQKAFAGKTGASARIGMLLANSLLIAPIQTFVFLASMAVIGGARSVNSILGGVKAGYMKVLKVTWMTSPTAMIIAQNYIPLPWHIVWFNAVSFTVGTSFATILKKARLRAIQQQQQKEKEKEKEKAQ